MNIKYLLIYSCTTSEYKKKPNTQDASGGLCRRGSGFTQIYRLQRNSVTLIFWICTIVHDGATQKTVPTDSFEGRWGGYDEAFSRMLLMEDGGDQLRVSTRGGTVVPPCMRIESTGAWTSFCWDQRLFHSREKNGSINEKSLLKIFFMLILFHLNLCLGLDIWYVSTYTSSYIV